MTIRLSNQEAPCTHEASDSHFANVKLRNALLRMLPVCIHSYLKSFLRYKL